MVISTPTTTTRRSSQSSSSLAQPGPTLAAGATSFQATPGLGRELAARSGFVFGVDPDPNVRENAFDQRPLRGHDRGLHDEPSLRTDHAAHGGRAHRGPRPHGGQAGRAGQAGRSWSIVYTVNKWSPVPIIDGAGAQSRFHYRFKQAVWGGEERDTFPTAFKLNTRRGPGAATSAAAAWTEAVLRVPRRLPNLRQLPLAELRSS